MAPFFQWKINSFERQFYIYIYIIKKKAQYLKLGSNLRIQFDSNKSKLVPRNLD
jgi:hypothetical protein